MAWIKTSFSLLKSTFKEWNDDGAPMLAAALAYYTAFSIAPLIILIVAIVGVVVGQDSLQSQILQEIEATVGEDTAVLVADLIDQANQPSQSIISTLLGIGALLIGALGVFNHLQSALDRIWNVADDKAGGGIKGIVKDKLLSFGMILIIGFLLLVSLVLSTALSLIDNIFSTQLPASAFVLRLLSMSLSLGVTTVLFMFIYKFLPHAKIEWRDVWIGAFVTAVLFTIGRTLLAQYLANSATASTYGAAGALVLVLFWVYYSAQIVLFGAEFTQVFARRFGSQIVAKSANMSDGVTENGTEVATQGVNS